MEPKIRRFEQRIAKAFASAKLHVAVQTVDYDESTGVTMFYVAVVKESVVKISQITAALKKLKAAGFIQDAVVATVSMSRRHDAELHCKSLSSYLIQHRARHGETTHG